MDIEIESKPIFIQLGLVSQENALLILKGRWKNIMLNSELNFSCASLKINKEKTLYEKKNLWEKKVNSLLFFEG